MEVEVGEEAVIRVCPCWCWLVNLPWGVQLRFERSWEKTRRQGLLCPARCLDDRRFVMRSIIRIALHRSQPAPATYVGHLGFVKAYEAQERSDRSATRLLLDRRTLEVTW
jgi:hypothetical protein